PALQPFVLPPPLAVLLPFFSVPPQGTPRIGRTFCPLFLLWVFSLAMLCLFGVMADPSGVFSVDPRHALRFLFSGDAGAFLVLGGVFLCVTGAEALYADMGHFGTRPIRLAWLMLVFPSLVLNYAGQTALVLNGASTTDNIFYQLCPSLLLIPLV